MKKNSLRPYKPYAPYLYLLPAMIIMFVFVFFPLLQAFYYSFHEYNLVAEPVFVGLDNYKKMFGDKNFLAALKNTFFYFLGVVPPLVIFPLMIAIIVNKKLRFIKAFRAAYYVPVITSMVVAAIAWNWIYDERGIFNYLLVKFIPFIHSPIPWLSSANTALFSVMVVTVWKGIGYYMVIYLAGLQGIPSDIWEAAEIDGATGLRKHLRITIPLSVPYIAVVLVMSSIAATKVFEEIYVLTGGGPYGSSRTLVYYIYETAFDNLKMGYASAMGFVLFLILLALSFVNEKISNK